MFEFWNLLWTLLLETWILKTCHLTSSSAVQDSPPMDLQLTNKLALVSGSTKGIGLAIATGLAREGARVIINGRAEKSVSEALAKIKQTVPQARLETFVGDLSDAAPT